MHILKKGRTRAGFTVMELLVVISIIALLSSILLVNVHTGRERSRDAIRTMDIDTLRKALIDYALEHGGIYPLTLAGLTTNPQTSYITTLPLDPLDRTNYLYQPYKTTVTSIFNAPGQECRNANQCVGYHLGANLEITRSFLNFDDDVDGSQISGDDSASCSGAAGRYCFDFVSR